MEKSKNIFDEVKALYTGQNYSLANPFMLNRLVSFVPETFLLATDVNRYLGLPKWAIRGLYSASIKPKHNAPYISLPKRKKVIEKQLTHKVSAHLCCSEMHAKQTIELLKRCGYKPEKFFGLKKDQ
jgi:hypothetical protein